MYVATPLEYSSENLTLKEVWPDPAPGWYPLPVKLPSSPPVVLVVGDSLGV